MSSYTQQLEKQKFDVELIWHLQLLREVNVIFQNTIKYI